MEWQDSCIFVYIAMNSYATPWTWMMLTKLQEWLFLLISDGRDSLLGQYKAMWDTTVKLLWKVMMCDKSEAVTNQCPKSTAAHSNLLWPELATCEKSKEEQDQNQLCPYDLILVELGLLLLC